MDASSVSIGSGITAFFIDSAECKGLHSNLACIGAAAASLGTGASVLTSSDILAEGTLSGGIINVQNLKLAGFGVTTAGLALDITNTINDLQSTRSISNSRPPACIVPLPIAPSLFPSFAPTSPPGSSTLFPKL